nr:MAG TPA: hypothetical protein [Caudoviricetes sp.]
MKLKFYEGIIPSLILFRRCASKLNVDKIEKVMYNSITK